MAMLVATSTQVLRAAAVRSSATQVPGLRALPPPSSSASSACSSSWTAQPSSSSCSSNAAAAGCWRDVAKLASRRNSTTTRAGAAEASTDDDTVELQVKVEGMMCDGCSSRIEGVLKDMANVKRASVSLDSKLATIEVAAQSQIDALGMLPTFVETIKELGFEAEPHIEYNPGS